MSKSIEDYRNTVKILKLQLLKIREQNSSISQELGIASEIQKSTFSPKIQKYRQSKQPFAKNILGFLNFAHRCQLVGINPQMVFRIADKKRDKQVSVSSLTEVIKRVKLCMADGEIEQLLRLITKNSKLQYEQYLKYLSAFQINDEKFPLNNARTYVQLCLINFCKGVKERDARELYREMNKKQNSPYCAFDAFRDFIQKNIPTFLPVELVAVFVSLDVQNQCQVQQSVFVKEIGKIFALLEKGITDDVYEPQTHLQPKNNAKDEDKKSNNNSQNKNNNSKNAFDKESQDYKVEDQTGAEAGNKQKKPATKANVAKVGLNKGSSKALIDEIKKLGLRVGDILKGMHDIETKSTLVKSFTFSNFSQATRSLDSKINKKQILLLFKMLDTEQNGSIDTMEIIKLWLRGKDISQSDQILYQLLFRHLRQIQYQEPLSRFTSLGFNKEQKINENMLTAVFSQLKLDNNQIKAIMQDISDNITVQQFSKLLKMDGKADKGKIFTKIDKRQYESLKSFLQKIKSKRPKQQNKKNFKKYNRGQQSQKNEQYWESIFTDEWACFEFCLQTTLKLQNFWRDPQFGPSKGDPHGYRSIVGNQSFVPPGLPDETQIEWMSFQEMLVRQKATKQKVVFLQAPLDPNDVVQGKIGNCWLVSAMSIIAKDNTYIKGYSAEECRKKPQRVLQGLCPYLFRFFVKYGLYVFKFFKGFSPVYVVVDELFPFNPSMNEIIFASSPQRGKQWTAFVEKAYAKLHHSYTNTVSGDISQGLNDLTNALPVKQSIQVKNGDNWDKMSTLNAENQLMGCSISAPKGVGGQSPVTLDDEKCGLLYGHAYSILDLFSFRTKQNKLDFNLIRVRNPWGNGQWLLDWSDMAQDPQYQKIDKYKSDVDECYSKRIEKAKSRGQVPPLPYEKKDDGQFLMNFEDFTRVYSNLFIGMFRYEYKGQSRIDKWDEGVPSGVCKVVGATEQQARDFVRNNHQYILQVNEKQSDVLLYMLQQDGRLYRGEKYPYKEFCQGMMIMVFTLTKNEPLLEKFDADKLLDRNLKFQPRREVNFWKKFDVGRYAIFPCKYPSKIVESQFQFRVYSSAEIKIKKVKPDAAAFKPILDRNADLDKNSVVSLVQYLKTITP